VKSLVNFEARDLEQWSRQVNGTTFLCLASVHHQKSNLNLKCTSGEVVPSGVAKMLTLCNLPKAAEAITEVTSNHLESWI
jgi:hypothetical protein